MSPLQRGTAAKRQGVARTPCITASLFTPARRNRQFTCPSRVRRDRSTAIMITFKRPDGKDCSAFYAEPAAGTSAPGMVVIQEWWGLNDQIKRVANRLAAGG